METFDKFWTLGSVVFLICYIQPSYSLSLSLSLSGYIYTFICDPIIHMQENTNRYVGVSISWSSNAWALQGVAKGWMPWQVHLQCPKGYFAEGGQDGPCTGMTM